jgi:hypothetical protein
VVAFLLFSIRGRFIPVNQLSSCLMAIEAVFLLNSLGALFLLNSRGGSLPIK